MQIHIPRLPMARGWREGQREGPQLAGAHPAQHSHPTTPGRTLPPGEMHPGSHSPQLGWIWVVMLGMAGAGLEGRGPVGGLGKGCPGDSRSDGVHVPHSL